MDRSITDLTTAISFFVPVRDISRVSGVTINEPVRIRLGAGVGMYGQTLLVVAGRQFFQFYGDQYLMLFACIMSLGSAMVPEGVGVLQIYRSSVSS